MKKHCKACGSSDACEVYEDHTHCYSCSEQVWFKDKNEEVHLEAVGTIKAIGTEFVAIGDRRISQAACQFFGVTVDQGVHQYPYPDPDGRHISNKFRRVDTKEFWAEGSFKHAGLFGQHLFPAGSSRAITLVEGELDALAAFDMQGRRFPVLSVKNGAGGAVRDCTEAFEYLNAFDKIVICFDKDVGKVNEKTGAVHYPGQEAAVAVANLFEIGKVRILTLKDYKDPCEYSKRGLGEQFVKEWWQAPQFTPTGLKLGKDMWDEISAPKKYETISYPFKGLNTATYGLRLSELVIITADTGVGKTSVVKEIEHHLLTDSTAKDRKAGVGLLHLEEANSDTALGLMSITASRPLHLPDHRERTTQEELRDYFDSTVNTDRLVVWDHFGSNSIHEVLAKIRHMHNLGCKYIVLDHLSIVVSDQSGDERKQLDEITTKLKTLCMELNIAVIAVIHQNRSGQIRGTAGVEQLANLVMKLHRDQESPDPSRRNITKVVIQKNRFSGITGPALYVRYNNETGRLTELDPDEISLYEGGEAVTEKETWF